MFMYIVDNLRATVDYVTMTTGHMTYSTVTADARRHCKYVPVLGLGNKLWQEQNASENIVVNILRNHLYFLAVGLLAYASTRVHLNAKFC